MHLLDTNVVSALRRIDRASPQLRRWAVGAPLARLYLSVITILEIEQGILLVGQRDPAQATILRQWLNDGVLVDFEGRVLPVDVAVARRCAALHVPDPRADRDALIAATALAHGMSVVTRNIADFAATGVLLINPCEDPA